MNHSGRAVKRLGGENNLQTEQIIVIHDELDLAPGQVRIKFGGGLAGHNGLRSIAAELGSRDFYRVRMGIGRPEPGIDITRHVLTPYFPWEEERLSAAIDRAVEGIRRLCIKGMQASMNFVHAETD
jgi:PTH1 family peptidyl-tRNA hydrolase